MNKSIGALWIILFLLSAGHSIAGMQLQEVPGIRTGEQAPDFTAQTHEGKRVTLSEVYANGPVVLVFYRGAWCAYCNLHLKQFQNKLDDFNAKGATVLGVSIDLKAYGAKTVQDNSLGFDVISDAHAEILESYKLLFKVPDELAHTYKTEYGIDLEKHSGRTDNMIAVPATYIIDSSGKVAFAYASYDYKVRTSPQAVLIVLEDMQSASV